MENEAGRRTEKSAAAFRTISEVAAELGLPQHVLRFWESKFAQIRPLKRAGGRRYYRPDDLELLRRIRALLYDEGYTIKGVQRLLRENGAKAVLVLARLPAPSGGPGEASGEPAPASADRRSGATAIAAVAAVPPAHARPGEGAAGVPAPASDLGTELAAARAAREAAEAKLGQTMARERELKAALRDVLGELEAIRQLLRGP